MPFSIDVPAASAAVTADSTSAGIVTVGDTGPFYPGAWAWLSNTTPKNQKVLIVRVLDGAKLQCRLLPDDGSNVNTLSYAVGGDLSAFTLALGSRIEMPQQAVRIEYANSKRNVI